MCSGGGDGGQAEARRREQEREARMSRAIREVNKVFGLADEDLYQASDAEKKVAKRKLDKKLNRFPGYTGADLGRFEDYDQYVEAVQPRVKRHGYGPSEAIGFQSPDQFKKAKELWNQQQAFQSPEQLGLKEAKENQEQRESMYTDTRQAVIDRLMHDLNRDRSDQRKSLTQSIARRGLSGGSYDVDRRQRMLENYQQGVTKIADRGQSVVDRVRAEDESARLDLISRIRAGMRGENAVASAANQMAQNVALAKEEALAQPIGQVFENAGSLYVADQKQQGRNKAYRDHGPSSYLDPGSYRGSTS